MAEAKDKMGMGTIDREEFEIIVRKYRLFEGSDYLVEAYEMHGKVWCFYFV